MKNILTILLMLFCGKSIAQNLVLNPSFEQYNNCPYLISGPSGLLNNIVYSPTYDSFPTVQSWVAPLIINSPDYYNTCDTMAFGHGVPNNSFGIQKSHSGNGYAGLYMYTHRNGYYNNYKEFIEAKLKTPLIPLHQYHLHFYVSLAVSSVFALPGTIISVNKIGAYLSDTMVLENLGYTDVNLFKPATIQSSADMFITDTASWTKIEGNYTAHGGEQWITLGRFSDGQPQRDTFLYSIHDATHNNDSFIYCYMYIDDVCVMDITNNITDSAMCVVEYPQTLYGYSGEGSYLWSTGDTTRNIIITKSGIYWKQSSADCLYHMDTFRVNAAPSVSFGPDKGICKNPPYILNNNNLPYTHYLWNTGDTVCCITIDTTGLYSLVAFNECGRDSAQVHLTVLSPCENCVLAPDAFTPNGDGRNDVFKGIVICQLASYQLWVYNRWGQLIYTTTDASAGWDGTYRGAPQDMDRYFYRISYKTIIEGTGAAEVKGDFTLVR